MNVLTNSEFENLVVDQPPRLKAIARQRHEQDPSGFLDTEDIQEYAKVCAYSGDQASSKWLKNLAVVYKNGTLQRIRTGKTTWADHVAHVNKLHAANEVKFNIGQHVFVEDEGRYGSVVDYMPDSKEYLVVLDPFQVKQYKKKDLEKVAKQCIKGQKGPWKSREETEAEELEQQHRQKHHEEVLSDIDPWEDPWILENNPDIKDLTRYWFSLTDNEKREVFGGRDNWEEIQQYDPDAFYALIRKSLEKDTRFPQIAKDKK